MLFVGTSIIHPSTEGVFLLCNILDLLIYSRKNIIIEDNVMVGVNCVIYDTDFHSIYIEDRLNENINIIDKPVRIKSGAWIGGHSIILKGVTIGKNSVIGAGSIVTHDIPDNEVWAGNPAKYIKKFKIY